MSRTQKVTRVRRLIGSMGLLPTAFAVWRNARDLSPSQVFRNNQLRRGGGNLRIPPGDLLMLINGTRDVDWFFTTGQHAADSFRQALARIHRPIESFEAVLDFGCGCGRVLRQWVNTDGPTFHGTDYNPRLVRWSSENLPFEIRMNDLNPPLSYPDGSFDLCYAISVFTHLPEHMQESWLRELHRVLKPEGILLVTLSGEGDLVRTTPAEQARFRGGELLVLDGEYAGTNLCGVYHPECFVRKNWSRYFSVLEFVAEGAVGTPRQDLYVLSRHSE